MTDIDGIAADIVKAMLEDVRDMHATDVVFAYLLGVFAGAIIVGLTWWSLT